MWQEETNSDDRRFLKDIGPIIALAIDGDLSHAHGIVAYFCQKVTAGVIPDIRVTRFVVKILISSQPRGRLKRWERNRWIRQKINFLRSNGKLLKPSRESKKIVASVYVADLVNAKYKPTKEINEDRVLAIYYADIPPLLVLDKMMKSGIRPSLTDLVAVLPEARDLYRKLLHPQNGKRSRERLDLSGSSHPKLSKLIAKEDIKEVNQLISEGHSVTSACKIITKGCPPGIWEQVRKTWHRHKKKEENQSLHRDNSGQKAVKPT